MQGHGMDTRWRIVLLGGLRVEGGDRVLTRFRTQKAGVLLGYLAYHLERPHLREQLIEMLWPESEISAGRNNLSKELYALRQELEPPGVRRGLVLAVDRALVRLNPEVVTTDVAAFEAALKSAECSESPTGRMAHLAEAVDGYGGELLPGYYADWVLQEREWLAERYFQALGQLLAHLEQARELPRALEYARRGVRADPLREDTHRDLMRLFGAVGQPAAALRQYRELKRLLKQELDAEPSPRTQALACDVQRFADRIPQFLPSSPIPDPPKSSDRPHNLPRQLTSFIGREREMAEVNRLLASTRLLTLTGAGGCGKTRLALRMAAELLDGFAEGIFFVDLAPISDPGLVASTIAQALGVRGTGGQPLRESLREYLRAKQLLLLLDNFEQVLGAAPVVVELLAAAPRLKVLVTSRAALRVRGEQEFPVAPLPVPNLKHPPPVEALSQYGAVELFIQRAVNVKPGFVLTSENALAVTKICHRLDGLPLAVELAAARVKLFPLDALLSRLENRLKLLTGGARDLPTRQQTLRSAIAWSYDLLEEGERKLFRRLSVFVGGFTLPAGEAVCNLEANGELDVVGHVTSLVDKSLLCQEEEAAGEPRFSMLETIREYGLECLAAAGEAETIPRRHAQFFLALAEEADPKLRRAQRREWLQQLVAEHGNLRAALAWSQGASDNGEVATRLAGALTWFWVWQGDWSDGRQWLEAALARSAPAGRTRARAKALFGAGVLAWDQHDLAPARSALEEAVAIWREVGDKSGLAVSLTHLGLVAVRSGDLATAAALQEESIPLSHEMGEHWNLLLSFLCLGQVATQHGDHATVRSCYEEALAIAREVGDPTPVAACLANLGDAASDRGDYTAARTLTEESLAIFRQLGDKVWVGGTLLHLGMIARVQGEAETARACLEENVAICQEMGDRWSLAYAFLGLGLVARDQEDHETADALGEQALAISRELDDRGKIARCLNDLGYGAYAQGDYAKAQALLQESLLIWRERNNRLGIAWSLTHLAEVADAQGEYEAASVALEEGMTIWTELNLRWNRAYTLEKMGRVAQHRGDRQQAATLFRESLALQHASGTKRGVEECLEGLAVVAQEEQQPVRAAQLFGSAMALREAIHSLLLPVKRDDHECHVAAARAALGEEAFAAAWAAGQAMSLEDAVAFALGGE
jgi:predicted ATPase/DNA-binding SARP family transcriptional activator